MTYSKNEEKIEKANEFFKTPVGQPIGTKLDNYPSQVKRLEKELVVDVNSTVDVYKYQGRYVIDGLIMF